MHRTFRAAFAALALTIAATAMLRAQDEAPLAGLHWRSLGPAVSGGRLGAVAGTDADPALYYAGAAGGGVWRTTTGGTQWTPVFDREDVQSIGAIAIDPSHEETVWVGTGESNPRNDVATGDGVYKTIDGAKTWSNVLPLHHALVSRIVVDPHDSMHVVVAVLGDPFADSSDRGIYVTDDGGGHWLRTLYLGPSSGASDLVADPAHPNVLFAGMWQFRRTGWSLQSGGPNDGLFRSQDGGATWTRLSGDGLPDEEEGRIGLAIAPSNPQRIYALIQTAHGLLWRSDDGGAHWQLACSDPLMDERPFYFSKIFVDPQNPDRVFAESVHMTISTDGGKRFKIAGRGTHGDHHAMWLAADGKRMIEGNDGGVAFSHDGGQTWSWDKSLPVSQFYHIGLSSQEPYRICGGLQDNGIWCAPSNPLDERGVSASDWNVTGFGDGTWAVFDPRDPQVVWQSLSGGNFAGDIQIHDFRTGVTRDVSPYLRDQNVIDPKDLRYRMNWETPIAFDPFDARTVYAGGNVLFATNDGGSHWQVRSPDLTRNDPSHEVITGGITKDGTGAETSDTILAIAPSRAARGELWIGTDDGLVYLTRDGGAHWHNVTPPGARAWGRFASIAPSSLNAGVAYAIEDCHMEGDRAPYVFATGDYGVHWHAIDAGLAPNDQARAIALDPLDPHLLYLGTERGIVASWDDGAHWRSIRGDLPPVSVRDIEIDAKTHDLVLATHGRGAYVLDDAGILETYGHRVNAPVVLAAVRDAVAWNRFSYFGTRFDGESPPYGAIVTYVLREAANGKAGARILDARGELVSRLDDLPAHAGVNRFTWDLTSSDVQPWTFAPKWNQGTLDGGAPVLPGRYTIELEIGGKTYDTSVVVLPDPRETISRSVMADHRARTLALMATFSRIDGALDALSAIAQEAPLRARALAESDPAFARTLYDLGNEATATIATITSNPQNDQDNDFLPDVLRERMQTQIDTYFGSWAAPTAEQEREDAVLQALAEQRLASAARVRAQVAQVDARLRARGLAPLETLTATPATDAGDGDDDRR